MNVDVVIVTYNRLEKLKKTISYYDNLTLFPRNIVIVNNNSTDGTKDFLEKWGKESSNYKKHIIHLNENIGGSGGFYEGQKYALGLNPDWIMLADDDAYPEADSFALFVKFVSTHNTDDVSAICSSVLNPDGTIDVNHRTTYRLIKGLFYERRSSSIEDYKKDFFEIDYLSYVGCFIKTIVLRTAGLVIPDYFIYSDDAEHSIRLKKQGKIICVPQIKIVHDYQKIDILNEISWKDYYFYRNEIDMIKRHHPFAAIAWSRRQYKLLKNNPKRLKVYKIALKDAWHGKLGLHEIYKPGWTDK